MNPLSGDDIEYFIGTLGELRIYPEPWKSPPRITERFTKYEMNPEKSAFGLPLETWSLGDITVSNDDVYERTTYAEPTSGSLVRNVVATSERRIFRGPLETDLGGYLDYSESSYDQLPLGQVKAGNITQQAMYGVPIGVTTKPIPTIVT